MNKTRRKRSRRATQIARSNGSQSRSFSGVTICKLYSICDGHGVCQDCWGRDEEGICNKPDYDFAFNEKSPKCDGSWDHYDQCIILAQYNAEYINEQIKDGYYGSWTNFAIEKINQWGR